MPDDDPVRRHPALLADQELRERGPDVTHEGGVELLPHETAHVVGLDDLADHAGPPGVRGLGVPGLAILLSWR